MGRSKQTPELENSSLEVVARTEQYLDRLKLPADVLKLTSGMVYADQTKYVRWEIPADHTKQIELLQMTDMQFGHIQCKEHRVIEYRDWILKSPNRYMLWTGDNVDAGHILSKGSPFDQKYEPQTQVLRFCELWAPARHRILGYVGGNHERRGIPTFGDLGTLIATLLRIPYSAGQQLLDIYYGNHKPFKIHLWHGVGGARTKGTVAQILDRFMQKGDAHVYLMGHVHTPMIIPTWKEHRDHTQQRVILRKSMGGVGSSFLDTWGTYAEVAGFNAHDVMMPMVRLDREGGWELVLR